MTRTTPELGPLSPNYHSTPTAGRLATNPERYSGYCVCLPNLRTRVRSPAWRNLKCCHDLQSNRTTNLSAYLAERFNPCHGNLCDNPLPLPTTRFRKPFRQAFFAIWDRPQTRRISSGIGFRTWIPPAPKPRPYQ
ncbi:hypothetical protein AVEN_257390-1 [Araneus ventricosus]|uniref:Uncharacterized protein n=1 Tax=Araneus ventricosus TaxID=182803 RepID=A0A4Y2CAY6_ARAVE|nr:hypothetical protein AVEN_257390-1 [Araneus ventricosus]